MKKQMFPLRIVVTILLSMALICTPSTFAFANDIIPGDLSGEADDSTSINPGETLTFEYDGNGMFTLLQEKPSDSTPRALSLNELNNGGLIDATAEDTAIFKVGEDKFLIQADGSIYTLADELYVDYREPEKWFEGHKDSFITDAVKNAIITDIERQNGAFDDNYEIVIYVPASITSTSRENPRIIIPSDPGSGEDPGYDDSTTSEYTYNSYTLRTTVIRYGRTGTLTQYLSTNWRAVLSIVQDVFFTMAGFSDTPIGAFLNYLNALLLFTNLFSVQTGDEIDKVEMNVGYYYYQKYTHVKDSMTNEWYTSLGTHHVKINNYYYAALLASIGTVQSSSTYNVSKNAYSSHYSAPSAAAIASYNSNPLNIETDAHIYLKFINKTLKMSQ